MVTVFATIRPIYKGRFVGNGNSEVCIAVDLAAATRSPALRVKGGLAIPGVVTRSEREGGTYAGRG